MSGRLRLSTVIVATAVLAAVVGCTGVPPRSPSPSGATGVPSAFIDAPAAGTIIAVGQTLQVNARGQDTVGVTRLDLRVGDVLVDTATTPTDTAEQRFSALLEWTPSAEGLVTISVLSYRADGTGSLPATIDVTVGATAATSPSPVPGSSPSLRPGSTPAPGVVEGPTPTAGSTPATATPRPRRAPRPTAPPTPPPIEADLMVDMQDEDVPPEWTVGVPVQFDVYIRNNDRNDPAPRKSIIEVFAAGHTVTRGIAAKRIRADGGIEHYSVTVTPARKGERALRITISLPPGYVDRTPRNNVFRATINVRPEETPSGSPTPAP